MNAELRRAAVLGGAGVVALIGLVAEWQAFGPDGYASRGAQPWYPWILDFVTGATFLLAGTVAIHIVVVLTLGQLPRFMGWLLTAVYLYFLYVGLIA